MSKLSNTPAQAHMAEEYGKARDGDRLFGGSEACKNRRRHNFLVSNLNSVTSLSRFGASLNDNACQCLDESSRKDSVNGSGVAEW